MEQVHSLAARIRRPCVCVCVFVCVCVCVRVCVAGMDDVFAVFLATTTSMLPPWSSVPSPRIA
jgi:hypothetical protein